jgi:gliding motility-associated-like protein
VKFIFVLFIFSISFVFAQPANNNCSGAIVLPVNSSCVETTGTTLNATQTIAGCAGVANDDVWYSFVASQANIQIQVTGSAGFNPVVQVFSGSCGSGPSLGCINATGNGGIELVSLSSLIVGSTYWLRVYHFDATAPTTPTFTICITPQATIPLCSASAPAGNTCAEATLICDVNGYCGSTSASYTADSWPALSTAFCGSIENNSFIQFVANASTVSLNVWVTSSSSNLGIQILVFSTPSCGGPVTSYTCVSPLAPSPTASSVTASGLTPGQTYYMMIDGYAGDVCNYVIGVNSGIQVSGQIISSATNVCLGTPVTLTAGGGNGVYVWNPSPDLSATSGSIVTATPTTQGAHVYTMTTNSSNPLCPSTSVSTVTVNAFSPPTPNAGIDDTVCLGSPIALLGASTSSTNATLWQYLATGIAPTPTVSFSPNFSNLTPTVNVNQPGLYKFILRETNTVCGINRDTVNVLVLSPTQTLSYTPPSCFGVSDAEIQIDNATAIEYSFDNGLTWQADSMFGGFAAGTYTVCSRNYLGCQVCSSVTISDPLPLQLNVSNDTLICENGTANLFASANGGTSFLYHWDFTSDTNGNQPFSPLTNSTVTVYAENNFGCLSLAESITISVRPSINASITPSTEMCPGIPTTLTALASGGNNGPFQFTWSTGAINTGLTSSQLLNPTLTTTYTVVITDGCESTPLTLTSEIEVLPLPIPLISSLSPSVCEPASFIIQNETDPNMVEHLYWTISNGQQFTDQETVTTVPMDAGMYNVQLIVESPNGCIDSITFFNFLTVYPQPTANFTHSPNPVKMFNTEVQLTNYSSNGVSYEWFVQEGNPSYSQSEDVQIMLPDGETGSYEVLLITTSSFGCIDSLLKTIVVLPEILLYAPNTFTPDGDEFNQEWGIQMSGMDAYNFELRLYNRWGQLIWESYDPNEMWDGTYKGTLVQQGTYTWTIEAKDPNNDNKFQYSGHVLVLR